MRDEYIDQRQMHHQAEILCALANGDAELLAQMDDALGAALSDRQSWARLIQATAQGKHAFAQLLENAIAAEAENRALKDAEAADAEHRHHVRRKTYPRLAA